MFDAATMGQAFSGPGMDTRQWLSYGWVAEDTPEQRSVRFKDDTGEIIPEGPLVTVVLQPSGITVTCRVGMGVAGDGEGDWHPLLQRDEVMVAIPQGDERAGCVIIARLYNSFDKWPTTVAGMDATKNNFAYRRVRTPYVLEVGPSLMLRSANTGAAMTFTPEGEVFLASGDGHLLALTGDVVGLQTAGSEAMVQLDPSKGQVGLYGKSASFLFNETDAQLQTTGKVSFGTSGNGAFDHVTTAEAAVSIVYQVGKSIAAALTPPIVSVAYDALVAAALLAASGGGAPALVQTALSAALAVPKVPGNPGVGCPGFLAG